MFKHLFVLFAAALWFAGCAQQPAPNTVASKAPVIEGVTWQLMSFGNHAMKVPQKAWLKLENGKYAGFAGCNGLSGTYMSSDIWKCTKASSKNVPLRHLFTE
ncbi:META domain-containing protein [Hydrogenimonas sp.]